ncbi:MAG: N-acetylmuramoyl-L-alanine amidase [Planctomycetota bacterium]
MRVPCCLLTLLALTIIAAGCRTPAPKVDPMLSVHTLLPEPNNFLEQRIGSNEYPIPPYAKYLAGVKICLDPGHGGDAHKAGFKRGPTGVREAEMNLRIARYLQALLETTGAEVLLTRDGDEEVSLADRAAIANEWGADLFISLHHNAIDNKPQVNRTSVWYHSDVDYRPANLDLARYLWHGLHDSLALPQITGVPLKSDNLMYDRGFGILRHADVTAALCESSFFTNPDEEQRLRDPEYNLLEAYGIFIGLAKYAYAGLPRVNVTGLVAGISTGEPDQLFLELDDGLRARKSWGSERQMILTSSITIRIDGEHVPYTFINDGYILRVELPTPLQPGPHAVEVQFQNMFKNSVLNPHFVIDAP